jgi:hypothetical protein
MWSSFKFKVKIWSLEEFEHEKLLKVIKRVHHSEASNLDLKIQLYEFKLVSLIEPRRGSMEMMLICP